MSGRLVLVATPIGNLADLSRRAIDTLSAADIICCEDTRHTRALLTHAGIRGPRLVAVHEHNEAASAVRVAGWLQEGRTVAVVTDAGTPVISDPGRRLVRAAIDAGAAVTVVPGPSAALAALVVSGLPADRWCFEGFLPTKGGERARRLQVLEGEERTAVLYEAPHRIRKTMADLLGALGPDRDVVVARELTKLHETVWRGTVGDAVSFLDEDQPRGEYVIVLGGAAVAAAAIDQETIATALASHLEAGEDRRAAITAVARQLGVPRREVYDVVIGRGHVDG